MGYKPNCSRTAHNVLQEGYQEYTPTLTILLSVEGGGEILVGLDYDAPTIALCLELDVI